MDRLKQNSLKTQSALKFISQNKKGQASTEYILFVIVLFAASYGMIKLFIWLWQYKFFLLGYGREVINAFI
jgi:hypothetical protein